MATTKEGVELKPGDIVTVTTKYRVLEVRDDSVLAQKVYDLPASILTATGENIILANNKSLFSRLKKRS